MLWLACAWMALAASIPPAGAATFPSDAPPQPPVRYATDRIVLKLRPDVAHAAHAEIARAGTAALRAEATPTALASLRQVLAGARLIPEFPAESPAATHDLSVFWIARLDPRMPLESALAAAKLAPEVESAEPVAYVPVADAGSFASASSPAFASAGGFPSFAAAAPPNDSLWNLCYWLQQPSRRDLHILEAWETTRGTDRDVIAILDTGILRWHPDIGGVSPGDWGSLWTNAAERDGAPGVDDDGNGYVDDVWGWDFIDLPSDTLVRAGEDWRDEDNDPEDFAVHGTAVAGVAVAHANNVSGTPGVAPGAKVMALRVGYSSPLSPPGYIDQSAAARAILYAIRNGASVINCSFSSVNQTDLNAAVEAAFDAGVLVVVAAGNNGTPYHLGGLEQTIAVTASDQNDKITAFSNRGGWVDLAAPGQSIATTTLRATGTDSIGLRTPSYSRSEAGTSFSTPMVSAAASMMQSARRARGLPPYNWSLALLRLSETCDSIASVNTGDGYGYGRLNVKRLLDDPIYSTGSRVGARSIGPPVVIPDGANPPIAVYVMASNELLFVRAATGDTVRRVPLGGVPVGGITSADMGPGLGRAMFVGLADGRLAGFDSTGVALPGWPVTATGATGGDAMAALGDVDGDGFRDVVWGGNDGRVYAWRFDGTAFANFPRAISAGGINIRLALSPSGGCVGKDILALGANQRLYAINPLGGDTPGWPIDVLPGTRAPIIARLDASDAPTIVLGGGNFIRTFDSFGRLRWQTQILLGTITGDLAAGDLDGDGYDEILARTEGEDYLVAVNRFGGQIGSRRLGGINGPLLIGPLSASPGAQVAIGSADLQGRYRVLAFDRTLSALPGWPRVGFGSDGPVIADVDGDGRTEVLAGAGPEQIAYVYDAGASTWRTPDAYWPTPRGDDARTSCRIHPPLAPAVDLPPTAILDLRAFSATTRAISVRWTAPAHPGNVARATAYEFRMSTQPLTAENFSLGTPLFAGKVPLAPGSAESGSVSGLQESRNYWMAVRSKDACGRWSAISNVLQTTTQTIPPAPVLSLDVFDVTDSVVTLYWVPSGEDGVTGYASRYLVHLSESAIDETNFDDAPFTYVKVSSTFPGPFETLGMRGLPAGKHLHAALRALDAVGNASGLSNTIELDVPETPVVPPPPVVHAPPGMRVLSPARLPVAFAWHGADDAGGRQRIAIYDAGGRLRATLPLEGREGIAAWDGHGASSDARAGVYFVRFTSGSFEQRSRFVLLR